jgi:cytochrome c553
MKLTLIATAAALVLFGHAVRADQQVDAGEAVFERTCSKCHYEDDFAGKTREDILGLIRQMAAPGSGHKFDLGDLSEGEMADLAAYFASVK